MAGIRPGAHGRRTSASLAPIALALSSALLFGASAPASKALLRELTAFQLAGLLYLGAAVGLLPLLVAERRRGSAAPSVSAGQRLRLAGAILFGGVLGPLLLLQALRLAPATGVSLLLNLELAATAVLGVLLFREPLGRAGWLAIALLVAAGVVVSWGGGWPGWTAALLVAGACVFWGLDNHLTAVIDGLTPTQSTFLKGVAAGTFNLLLAALQGQPLRGPWIVGAALLVGALSYGASIVLYISAAQRLGATRAQAYFASSPFLGAALSLLFLGEPMRSAYLLAAVLLVVGTVLLTLSQHEHEHTHAAVEHVHSHRHDDGHHLHVHPGLPAWTRHTHWHRHEEMTHSHPHLPDLHHRHRHDGRSRRSGRTTQRAGSSEP